VSVDPSLSEKEKFWPAPDRAVVSLYPVKSSQQNEGQSLAAAPPEVAGEQTFA